MPTNRSTRLLVPRGPFRARDAGISRVALGRLAKAGDLERIGRGVYALPRAKVTEHHTLVQAAVRVPHGVICLLSALRFHEMTTQSPHEVWMAIGVKARKPTVGWPSLRIVRFSGTAFTFGIEKHVIENVTVRITSREKTVADCFKYRNKLGLDVALEALRDYLRSRRRSVDALMEAAAASRVQNVIRPYLEAMA
jgi:predicted transcriptional regulator of viral defense system